MTVKPSIHPDLKAHVATAQPKMYTFDDKIHMAFAYSPSSCTLIEGENECILVDTLPNEEYARTVAAEYKKITDKPINTVVLTHFHHDHIGGIHKFISEADVRAGKVEIIGHHKLVPSLVQEGGLIAPIMGRRVLFQFGFQLPHGVEGSVGSGLGPINVQGKRGFMPPTRTFDDRLDIKVDGIDISLIHVPSETDDQIVVWLPKEKVLISADVIQGETFPNIYPIRGARFRDPMIWVKSIDKLRELGAELLIPHHGRPVEGKEAIEDVLMSYRDAIQYMHDQTVRNMNMGMTPDEIADAVTMPAHLKGHPWLGEYYGSYKHSVRNIYSGYLGWWQGDPVSLDPLPWRERAERYVEIMGGRDKILAEAQQALNDGNFRWAADILSWVIRADRADTEARTLKAQAMREFGYSQKTATWRNAALTTALELEGKLRLSQKGLPVGSPTEFQNFPAADIFELMTVRLKAEESWDTRLTIAFETTDTGERCALEIRRGVCQFHRTPPGNIVATVRFDREFLAQWTFGHTSFEDGLDAGQVSISGDKAVVIEFLEKFETVSDAGEVRVSVR